MSNKETSDWRDEAAVTRFKIIAPLLDEGLDDSAKLALRKRIAEKYQISLRSVYRYENTYRQGGFEALKPSNRVNSANRTLPKNFDMLLREAIQLKREVPSRSVNQIILILEMEGLVAPGVLKRSTLQRHLYNAGFGKKQMKKYAAAEKSSTKRFCKPHRMMLVQADIKFGPKLPIGPNRRKVQTYLSAIIDDHSKLILASAFYSTQNATIVEDTYRKAILKYGVFDATYVDNGKQYVSRELVSALSKLGIRHLRAKPYAAWSKGKIEVYNRFVNAFLAEIKVHRVNTLEKLNYHWNLWVEDYYHNKAHEGIREYYESHNIYVSTEGITPLQEFNRDQRPLKFLDANRVGEAFLHREFREVDKGACISLAGRKYEVHASLIGAKVTAIYDPVNTDTITIEYPGIPSFKVHPLRIGEFCDKTPEIPLSMLPQEPESSRFLDALERTHKETSHVRANAISFGAYRKDGENYV